MYHFPYMILHILLRYSRLKNSKQALQTLTDKVETVVKASKFDF